MARLSDSLAMHGVCDNASPDDLFILVCYVMLESVAKRD